MMIYDGGVKVKSCPFCGGEPYADWNNESAVVRCRKCGASVEVAVSAKYAALYRAVETWNRRVKDD